MVLFDAPSEFGTPVSWLRDLAIAGALYGLVGSASVFGVMHLPTLSGAPRPLPAVDLAELPYIALGVAATGAVLGAASAVPLWSATRAVWRVAPVLAFAIGPALGAAALLVALTAGGALDPHDRRAVIGLVGSVGCLAAGPPWVSYLAARAADRPGIGGLVACAAWIPVPVLFVAGILAFG